MKKYHKKYPMTQTTKNRMSKNRRTYTTRQLFESLYQCSEYLNISWVSHKVYNKYRIKHGGPNACAISNRIGWSVANVIIRKKYKLLNTTLRMTRNYYIKQ